MLQKKILTGGLNNTNRGYSSGAQAQSLRALMIRKSTFVLIVTWNEWTFSGELSAPE